MIPVVQEYPPGVEMVSVCSVPARGGRSCERFGGYKTINRIHLPLLFHAIHVHLPLNYDCDNWFVRPDNAFCAFLMPVPQLGGIAVA